MRKKPYFIQPNYSAKRVGQRIYDKTTTETDKWDPVFSNELLDVAVNAINDQTPRLLGISPELDAALEKHLKGTYVPNDWGTGTNGNVRPYYDTNTKKFTWTVPNGKYENMYQAMSSALLLYRLLCLFQCQVQSEGPEGYKCTWWVTIKHKQSGEILQFGEWKGAAGIWTRFSSVEQLPKAYADDIISLMNVLYAHNCPHPYDGCVAGSVA